MKAMILTLAIAGMSVFTAQATEDKPKGSFVVCVSSSAECIMSCDEGTAWGVDNDPTCSQGHRNTACYCPEVKADAKKNNRKSKPALKEGSSAGRRTPSETRGTDVH